jgi:hypothetical protein
VQTAADDHDVALTVAERATQQLCLLPIGAGRRQIVFHVTGDPYPRGWNTESPQTLGVLFGLDRQHIEHP